MNSNFSSIDTILNNISTSAIPELESPVRIWGLADGIYKLPQGCTVYYNGETALDNIQTPTDTFMSVVSYNDGNNVTYKYFFMLYGNSSGTRYMRSGYTTSTTGSTTSFVLTSVLTSISSYVKDNLTYSTAGTTYALSAYQGYVLDQGKQNKVTYSTTDLTAGTSQLTTGELYFVYE